MPHLIDVADHAADTPPALDAGRVEPKVKAATIAATAAAGIVLPAVLWALSTYLFGGGEVPIPLQQSIGGVLTGGFVFVAGWFARHVDREQAAGVVAEVLEA